MEGFCREWRDPPGVSVGGVDPGTPHGSVLRLDWLLKCAPGLGPSGASESGGGRFSMPAAGEQVRLLETLKSRRDRSAVLDCRGAVDASARELLAHRRRNELFHVVGKITDLTGNPGSGRHSGSDAFRA